jgi:hypothetical protein
MVQVLLASPDRCNSKPYLRAHWMALMGLLIGLRADAPPSSTNSARPTTSFMVFRGKHAKIAGLTVPVFALWMPPPPLPSQCRVRCWLRNCLQRRRSLPTNDERRQSARVMHDVFYIEHRTCPIPAEVQGSIASRRCPIRDRPPRAAQPQHRQRPCAALRLHPRAAPFPSPARACGRPERQPVLGCIRRAAARKLCRSHAASHKTRYRAGRAAKCAQRSEARQFVKQDTARRVRTFWRSRGTRRPSDARMPQRTFRRK